MVAFFGSAAVSAILSLGLALTSPKSAPTAKDITTEEYSQVLQWLDTTFPSSYINPSISIQPSPCGGHGAFATSDIQEDELLFKIPREACITSSSILNDEECGTAFQTLMKKAGPGSFTVSMAGYLAKEYLCYLEGKESKFGPYLATLPWKRGWNGQEHVLFWKEEDVEEFLADSLCFRESTDLRSEVQVARRIMNAIVGPSILKARGEMEEEKPLIPFLEFTKPPPPAVKEPVSGFGRAITGAFVILLTRAFDDDFDTEIDFEDAERLIPILDMLNHNAEPTVRYSTNEDGAVEVKARRDVEVGEEIYNRYREEEELNMPYHRFFSRFGFVPGITEDIKNLLEDNSSIFFAKRKEI
jgi:hypothetical protein